MSRKSTGAARNLARNLAMLRRSKNMSQRQLAEVAEIPRSTITHIESGAGNPSLAKLAALSAALGVGVEELLSRPRNECQLLRADQIKTLSRAQGRVRIAKLLPERIKGIEIDRMEIARGSSLAGTPHVPGTKEYLHALNGVMTVLVAGQVFDVAAGDVLAFPGDQRHSYRNRGRGDAVAISVVLPVPVMMS